MFTGNRIPAATPVVPMFEPPVSFGALTPTTAIPLRQLSEAKSDLKMPTGKMRTPAESIDSTPRLNLPSITPRGRKKRLASFSKLPLTRRSVQP